MKNHHCLILLLFTTYLAAQEQPGVTEVINELGDTIYQKKKYFPLNGMEEVSYSSTKVGKLSKEDRFMRGLSPMESMGYYHRLDSIILYDSAQNIVERQVLQYEEDHTYRYVYDQEGTIRYVNKVNNKNQRFNTTFNGDQQLAMEEKVLYLQGKIGEQVSQELSVDKLSETETLVIYWTADRKVIRVPDSTLVKQANENTLRLTTQIARPYRTDTIRGTYGNGKELIVPVRINGYDVATTDFVFDKAIALEREVELINRKRLIIYADGPEKLLRIYREDQLIDHYPLGQQINRVNIKGFKESRYRLELVNLSNSEKSYLYLSLK